MTDRYDLTQQELEQLAELLPPEEEVIRAVTPWAKPMERIVWGLGLSLFKLNMYGLDHILPAIGLVLMLLGFRALRKENRGFALCFRAAAARCVLGFGTLALGATVHYETVSARFGTAIGAVNTALLVCILLGLWRALRQTQEKAGLPPKADSALWLILWYLALMALALVQAGGWLVFLAMLAVWMFLIRTLLLTFYEMDKAGFGLTPAPVRVSDRALASLLAVLAALGIAAGYLFFRQYPMDWQPAEEAALTETAEHLLSLGFPEEVLADLTVQDIEACKGAVQVVQKTDQQYLKLPGQENIYEPKRHIQVTHLAVKLTVEGEGDEEISDWKFIHHFRWVDHPVFVGTDLIEIWPAELKNKNHWTFSGALSGRVLYDSGGQTLAAGYASLVREDIGLYTVFGDWDSHIEILAPFSFPREAENARGYVAYDAVRTGDFAYYGSYFNYLHQCTPWQYPVYTAQYRRQNGLWHHDAFSFIQKALQ